ncbi:MAG: oligosaccharide flippase family protein [Flavobacteriales bacterium]
MGIQAIGSFKRNVITLMGGSALAQVIPLLATPLLTRIYSPEQFGALAILLAIANPLSLLVCGRYEMTIVLPKDDREARPLLQGSLGVAVLMAVLLGSLIWIFHDVLLGWLGVKGPGVGLALSLSPVLFYFMGSFQALNNWLVRQRAFTAMSFNRIVQTSAITLVSVAFGLWAMEYGLLFAYLIGWGLYLSFGLFQAQRKDGQVFKLKRGKVGEAIRRYRHFPLYNALPAVLNTAALSVPVFVITRLFDADVTGQFNLTRQAVFLPGMFIANAFMQVYTQQASALVSNGQPIGSGTLRLVRFLGIIGAALALFLIVAGPQLFSLIFGPEWGQAGDLARLMAVPFALQFVVLPLSIVLPALGRIKAYSIWQLFYFTLVLAISFVPFTEPEDYVGALAATESIAFLILAVYLYRSIRRYDAGLVART